MFTVHALRWPYEVRHSDYFEWFLRVKIEWRRAHYVILWPLGLSKILYISGVLRKFRMGNFRPVSTPMTASIWNVLFTEQDKGVPAATH